MSVLDSLRLNGTPYDFNGGTGTGWSATAKNLLIAILNEGVYGTDQSSNISALEDALDAGDSPTPPSPTPTGYTVTYNLSGYTSDNTQSTIPFDNPYYTATLTLNSGYESGTITVTMGGVDITSSAVTDGYILIQNVTGNIVITAIGTQLSDVPVVEGDTRAVLYAYSGDEESSSTILYQTKVWYATENCTEQADYEVTISNSTDANVALVKSALGVITNPYVPISDRTNIYHSRILSGSVPANDSIKYNITIPAGMFLALTGTMSGVEVTVKTTGSPQSPSAGYTAKSIASAAITTGTPKWYDSADTSGNVIFDQYAVVYGTSDTIEGGTYEVCYTGDYSIVYIGTYDGVDGNNFYNCQAVTTWPRFNGIPNKIATLVVPNGYKIVMRTSSGTPSGNLLLRKVSD